MSVLKFKGILQETGWLIPGYAEIDSTGKLTYLSNIPPEEGTALEAIDGYAIPGLTNAHSHAFQFAMAGMAERHEPNTKDDFWSWRERMYSCALEHSPEEVERIATLAYNDMVQRGFTNVVEFHYLHHDVNGKPYENRAELGSRLASAAANVGIRLTLVPVYYKTGNFNQKGRTEQRRFLFESLDQYAKLLESTVLLQREYPNLVVGSGVHSLRAAPGDEVKAATKLLPEKPFHIHVAEQQKEIEDSIRHLGCRPVEWMLSNITSNNLSMVHCTHMTNQEVIGLAQSNFQVVLCPSTEGNLGDGIFALKLFTESGGSWTIGTDSQVMMSPFEDLRWLDYAQRLTSHRRNTFDASADVMFKQVIKTGRKSAGREQVQFFQLGEFFDACVIRNTIRIQQLQEADILSGIIFTTDSADILGTIIGGKWIFKR